MDGGKTGLLQYARSHFAVTVLVFADSVALLFAVVVSLLLRFEGLGWPRVYADYLQPHLVSTVTAVAVYLCAFAAFRLYRCAWRFASLEMLWSVICANTIGLLGLIVVQHLMDGEGFPRSVLIMLWTAGIVLTGGERVLLRVLSIAGQHGRGSLRVIRCDLPQKRTVILGAGTNGANILRGLREDPDLHYSVIGFLDDNPAKKGVYISNVKVLGPLSLLKELVTDGGVDVVIVALPEVSDSTVRQCILECRKHKLPVKVVPYLRTVLKERGKVELVDFSVEDLLRRAPKQVDCGDIGSYVTGRRVLVTGAGGSIGSEMCRQIAQLNPASLVLLGHGENSIHQIYHELEREYPEMRGRLYFSIACVSHEARMRQVFDLYRPHVVFHAAAHKHVPIMEANEQEAVHNNVLGTRCLADACGRFGVEKVVLISTDKAANPCCVMGATKWLCEEVFRAMALQWPRTRYIAVRFGNVLGSRGSVVPVFRDQIQHGGPVTVTHPEMTRYFMTIPEAVRLVLEAGAVGESGKLYLLDMGDPVKVVDIAKDMIRLCGLEPDIDIRVEYTGIRAGERLHEELISPKEQLETTQWPGLSIIHRPDHFTAEQLADALDRMERASKHGSQSEVRTLLHELVTGAGRCREAVKERSGRASEPARAVGG